MKKLDANDIAAEMGSSALKELIMQSIANPATTYKPPVSCYEATSKIKDLSELLDDPCLLKPQPRVATTYESLDKALHGGFVRGGMYLIVGLTGRGKSTLAQNLARRMAQRNKVMLLSLEDDTRSTVRKLLAQQSAVPIRALENFDDPAALFPLERTRVMEAKDRLRTLTLKIDSETSDLDALELRVAEEASRGLEVLFVDQSSWLNVEKAEGAYMEASTISRRLKTLAKRLEIVVVVLVQFNRSGASSKGEGKPLELHQIRDSGRWEQDADGVLIIQKVDTEVEPANIVVDLKKHRHGPKELSCSFKFSLSCGLIEEDKQAPMPVSLAEAKAEAKAKKKDDQMTAELFAKRFLTAKPKLRAQIIEEGMSYGLPEYKVKDLLKRAVDLGHAYSHSNGINKSPGFSTITPKAA